MTDAYGNVLEPPGAGVVSEVKPGDIIAAMGGGILKKGVTLAAGQGVLAAGTVLGRVTATKKYVAYTDGGTNGAGSDVARGVLAESVDTTANDKLCNIIYGGCALKLSMLTGLTSAAISDFGGRSDAERDWFIF